VFTVTVPRADVSVEEVVEVLRQGLGPRYNVLAGTALNWNPVGEPRPDHPDTIVVGRGSNRLFRAQVAVSRRANETVLRVSPGGLSLVPRLTNRLWIARRVLDVLRAMPNLPEPQSVGR